MYLERAKEREIQRHRDAECLKILGGLLVVMISIEIVAQMRPLKVSHVHASPIINVPLAGEKLESARDLEQRLISF